MDFLLCFPGIPLYQPRYPDTLRAGPLYKICRQLYKLLLPFFSN